MNLLPSLFWLDAITGIKLQMRCRVSHIWYIPMLQESYTMHNSVLLIIAE